MRAATYIMGRSGEIVARFFRSTARDAEKKHTTDQFGRRARLQFLHSPPTMDFNRAMADAEPPDDALVGLSCSSRTGRSRGARPHPPDVLDR